MEPLKKTPFNKIYHDLKAKMMDFAGWELHHKVVRYVSPEEFSKYQKLGRDMGFSSAISGPLVRSSFHAAEAFHAADLERSKSAYNAAKEVLRY